MKYPDWTGQQVLNYANREIVQTKARDSLQVQPGVTVMNQGMAARLTSDGKGGFGVMSRNHPTNAVAANGTGGFGRLNTD